MNNFLRMPEPFRTRFCPLTLTVSSSLTPATVRASAPMAAKERMPIRMYRIVTGILAPPRDRRHQHCDHHGSHERNEHSGTQAVMLGQVADDEWEEHAADQADREEQSENRGRLTLIAIGRDRQSGRI